MELLQRIEIVMAEQPKPMHVNEIAAKLAQKFHFLEQDHESLPGRISSALSAKVKRKDSRFARVKNGKGGYKKGIYRLKKQVNAVAIQYEDAPVVSNLYTGKAGEHAVMAELLFWGFNASIMAVDDGIDIVASRGVAYFHIQVKTANEKNSGDYGFVIRKDRFLAKHSGSTYYVLVFRRRIGGRRFSEFIVLPSSDLRRMIDAGCVKSNDNLSLTVSFDETGRFWLNKTEDITRCLNAWGQIV